MLKLEKEIKSGNVAVVLKTRPTFLNKTFLKALFIAFTLHLSAFLIFKIDLLKIRQNDTILPPVILEADLLLESETFQEAFANLDVNPSLKQLLEIPFTEPSIPAIPHTAIQPSLLDKSPRLQTFPFLVTSKDLYPFSEVNLPHKPITFELFGHLAEKSFLKPSKLLFEAFEELYHLTPLKNISLSFKIDGQTGKAFWYQSEEKIPEFSKDFLNQFLKNLEFHILVTTSELEGYLEMKLSRETE